MADGIRITKRVVDALEPGDLIWDCDVKGFGVRCQHRAKVYVLKARIGGRQRWMVIGDHGAPWTAETARHEAQRLWGEIRAGVDVAGVRDEKRRSATVADLCDRYLDDHARAHKKPLSVAADERNIRNHIVPVLGRLRVADLTVNDVNDLKRRVHDGKTARPLRPPSQGGKGGKAVKGGPGAANRVIALLSKMMNLAEDWRWRPINTNPCHRISKYQGRKLERFLSSEELGRLGAVLGEMEESRSIGIYPANAIRLLIFTGARLNEILSLKWSYVDMQRRMLLLPDSKTGAKAIMLNQPALDVLAALPRVKENSHVFVGLREGDHLRDLQGPWRLVRRRASLADVRIHDLRHSFASFAALQGGSLPMIGRLLGHTATQTTARYTHLADNPIARLAEQTGQALAEAMKLRPAAEPAPEEAQ